MGKPISRTIEAKISYSRQKQDEKERTIRLLQKFEDLLELKDLSMMKDPSLIEHRIKTSSKFIEKSANKHATSFNYKKYPSY